MKTILVVCISMAITCQVAIASLIGIDYNYTTESNELFNIDQTTGKSSFLLSFKFDSGWYENFFVDTKNSIAFAVSTEKTLYKFNLKDLSYNFISLDRQIQSMEAGPDGFLIGIDYNYINGMNELFKIDPSTGKSYFLLSFSLDSEGYDKFFVDSENYTAYLVSTANTLYRFSLIDINYSTVSIDHPMQAIEVGSNGFLIGIDYNYTTEKNELFRIDPATGESSFLLSFSLDSGWYDKFFVDKKNDIAYTVSTFNTLYRLDLSKLRYMNTNIDHPMQCIESLDDDKQTNRNISNILNVLLN